MPHGLGFRIGKAFKRLRGVHAQPALVPSPERTPWLFAPPFTGYDEVKTPSGSVRYVPPRSTVSGAGGYPAAPPGPEVAVRKRPLDPARLAYFPRRHTKDGSHSTGWNFPASLDNPSCRWLQALKRLYADPISFPSALAPEAGLLVHALVRNIRPRVIIETGTFVGVSTMWMAAALAENGDGGVVHTFDDFTPIEKGPWRDAEMKEGRLGFVAERLSGAGLAGQVVIHKGNSSFEIRAFADEFRRLGGVQMAFLDGDHGVLGTTQDFFATEEVLATGGFALLHDTFPAYCAHDGARHLLDHLNREGAGVYEKVDVYLAPENYGLGLIRRIG